MTTPLSPNTQAILLLTAPLSVGRAAGSERPLTPTQYGRLALHLRETGRQPADLLNDGGDGLLQECARSASNGRDFTVRETHCIACGDPACVITVIP